MPLRYSPEMVREALEPHRERLFASYSANRPPGWSTDLRTKDMVCLGHWLTEELQRLEVSEVDRRTQQAFFNRWCRSDEDLFDLAARTLNAVLDGEVEQDRKPHHRWG